MSVQVLDFGCRLNIAEGGEIARMLHGERDLTVINGCAVTENAMQETAHAARRARRARPDARVAVTGCAGQVDPGRFAAMPEVDLVLGNREKLNKLTYVRPGVFVGDVMERATPRPPVLSGTAQTRAFVEIQTGCDHRCSFCIIPFGRGNSASSPVDAIVSSIEIAVERGQHEVVLTGVDLTGYRPSLAGLVSEILRRVPALPRLRLSSLDPAEYDDALVDLIVGEPRIMPHVHLSLQSGDALILKRMKRRHSPGQAVALVERLQDKRPEIAVGADLIAGFPTESDAMHASSLQAIDRCNLVFGHVFPYSVRDGTPAARMPQVDRTLAKRRAAELRTAVASRRAAWFQTLVGTTQLVLVERGGRRGHAPSFAKVDLDFAATPGAIVSVRVTRSRDDRLTGTRA